TPPTMSVPEASMRVVCFMPSEPVMPWTMTLESLVRKIAMAGRSLRCRGGELSGLGRGAVHGVDDGDEWVVGCGEDLATLFHGVAVEANDERLGGLVAEGLESADDSLGNLDAARDAAEDVDEHR